MLRTFVSRFLPVWLMCGVAGTAVICCDAFSGAAIPQAVVSTEMPTVRSFGAVGDGRHDDTQAIQSAIESGIGDIVFPRGTYRITKTITIDLDTVGPTSIVGHGPARVVMEGAGPAFRFVGTHGGTAAPATVRENVWKNQRTPMVTGLEIVGAHDDACGIEAIETMQLTITRTVIREALHAIHLVKRNRNVIVSDCHLYSNRGIGIFYDEVDLHQSNIIGCHISYNHQGGIVVRGGGVRNIHIGTCDIEGNMGGPGSEPTANILLDSTGGSTAEVAIVGCTIQHSHDAPNSANIRINGESTARPFTDETRHGNITIADNVLSDVQHNIDIRNTRGITITGNTCWKGFASNLTVHNCDNLVVSENVFERNPRYHYGDGSDSLNSVLFRNCNGGTISGNHVHGAVGDEAAVTIHDCQRLNITNCTFLDCGPTALVLNSVTNSRVSDCLVSDDRRDAASANGTHSSGASVPVNQQTGPPTQGIVVNGGSGIMLVDNFVHGRVLNGPAIRIQQTDATAEDQ